VREKKRWKGRIGGCYIQMEQEDESMRVMISYVQQQEDIGSLSCLEVL